MKNYDEFLAENNTIDFDLKLINKYINDDGIRNKIVNVFSSLSPKYQKMILEYFSNNIIDIDKIEQIGERFNILNKIKKFYDKGINFIFNIFLDKKNEEIGIFTTGAIILTAAIFIFYIICFFRGINDQGSINGFIISMLAMVITIFQCIQIDKNRENYLRLKYKNEIHSFNVSKKLPQDNTYFVNRISDKENDKLT